MTVAVVGHVEWAEAVRVEHLPTAGQIVHGQPAWSAPAGGGGVAAVALGRMAGEVHLFTALYWALLILVAVTGLLVLRGRWRKATTPERLHTPASLPPVTAGRGEG